MSLPDPVHAAIRSYRAVLEELLPGRIEHYRLFGSYARGQPEPDSDVDLAVVVHDLSWQEKVAAVEASVDISLDCEVDLSPLVISSSDFRLLVERETGLAHDIMAEGLPA